MSHVTFLITLYTCLMSHSFYINKPVTFLSLFHNSNNIRWQVQSVNEAIQYAVFSNYPTTFSHNSTSPDQHQHCSHPQSTLNATDQVSHPHLYKHYINKHKCLYFNSHVYRNQEGDQNIMKLQSALLQINFLPVFQNFKHCIRWVMIF